MRQLLIIYHLWTQQVLMCSQIRHSVFFIENRNANLFNIAQTFVQSQSAVPHNSACANK